MKKQEILDNIKDFLAKEKTAIVLYPDIVEKHVATNITSGFADKLDSINDPFERFLIATHFLDDHLLDTEQTDEVVALRDRHEDLLRLCLNLSRPGAHTEIFKLREFDRYISKFEIN